MTKDDKTRPLFGTISREPSESSMFRSVGYDPVSWTLELEFPSGDVYQHKAVPPEVYAALQKSESKGKFFGAYIRGKYAYECVFRAPREPGDEEQPEGEKE